MPTLPEIRERLAAGCWFLTATDVTPMLAHGLATLPVLCRFHEGRNVTTLGRLAEHLTTMERTWTLRDVSTGPEHFDRAVRGAAQ